MDLYSRANGCSVLYRAVVSERRRFCARLNELISRKCDSCLRDGVKMGVEWLKWVNHSRTRLRNNISEEKEAKNQIVKWALSLINVKL